MRLLIAWGESMIRRLVVLLAVALVVLAFWSSSPASAAKRPAQYPGPGHIVYLPIVVQAGQPLLPTDTPLASATSTPVPTPTLVPSPTNTATPIATATPWYWCRTFADQVFNIAPSSWGGEIFWGLRPGQWVNYFFQIYPTDHSIIYDIRDSANVIQGTYTANNQSPEAGFYPSYASDYTFKFSNAYLFDTIRVDFWYQVCTPNGIFAPIRVQPSK